MLHQQVDRHLSIRAPGLTVVVAPVDAVGHRVERNISADRVGDGGLVGAGDRCAFVGVAAGAFVGSD